jgi:hypothetical protein
VSPIPSTCSHYAFRVIIQILGLTVFVHCYLVTSTTSSKFQDLNSGFVAPHHRSDGSREQDLNSAINQPTAAFQPVFVRFSSVTQEISPEESSNPVASLSSSLTPEKPIPPNMFLTPQAQNELRNLSQSFQNSRLQQRRMSNFAFEPVSLPTSRVC